MDAVISGTAQINARIDRSTKEAGDATLAFVGSSPTKVIRALWTKLARGGEAYEQVMSVLEDGIEGAEAEGQPGWEVALDEADHLYQNLADMCGLDLATYKPLSDEELEEELYREFLEESEDLAYG